ncbi:Heat shock protein 70 [Thalassoporum mexicanum PCC 7367]|uniref:Hsp70 family protein n=1 Tax=Thalassoporum mexicanum TaxID=3457544 RepID=UPI00029FCCC4|nr:Hsp70 family protein [Pseudanabaena sp. PCC 7367]AFY71563.1 Heat shock protein 70 [Pseudanabaena sp. PCC 7367]
MTIVAIDFGTSNTIVCTLDPVTQTPRTLKFETICRTFNSADGEAYVVPSLVYIEEQGNIVIGEQVRSQRLGYAKPDRLFKAFKRELAANFRPPPRTIDAYTYTSEDIAEIFLGQIWALLKAKGIEPSKVIFPMPVGAFDAYLEWFRSFAEIADLPPIQLLDESTAAALGYAVQAPGVVVLVVDFGGGTLDLSLVRTTGTIGSQQVLKAEVIAKSDAYIGGIDIDNWIVEHQLRKNGQTRAEVGEIGWVNLLAIAERLKIQLSSHESAKESWFDDENIISYELSLNRAELAEILESQQLLEQLRQSLDEVVETALRKGISKNQIAQVLLVGGSCQIPAIQQLVISYFGRQRVKLDKPFEAVAHGALALGQIVTVEDYLRHSYAIRIWDPGEQQHFYYPIFEQGVKYPCDRLEPVVLQVVWEGQKEIRLDIGEVAETAQVEIAYDDRGRMTSTQLRRHADFHSLLEANRVSKLQNEQVCIAHLSPPGRKGMDRIEVDFRVNEQRVLTATVKDLLTKKILVKEGAIAKLE